ncbi:hypothetical protein BOTBODRAFT_180122 [Botryobasidium botryosum FD-172 SS1]|uniref:MARVEL domain-containing protein n=1 Tax=Botryobasidium botryosum (strain FD-172 SS1) TaxID=930990 RepID=A0A067LXI1_BOTB1|nr:hypothetical protein BOTBODRAFT_180122 [Botryobasidium botryosum FD-172 SS1]
MPSDAAPLKPQRIVALFLAFALAVVGAAAGLNAIVKKHKTIAYLQSQVAPLGIKLDINTNQITTPGAVLTAGLIILALVSFLDLALLLLPSHHVIPSSTRFLGLTTLLLAFSTVWIFASLVPVTVIAAHGQAKVAAYVHGISLPDAVIKSTEGKLGFSRNYWTEYFIRLFVIAPWVSLVFGAIATLVSFIAWRRSKAIAAASSDTDSVDMGEK